MAWNPKVLKIEIIPTAITPVIVERRPSCPLKSELNSMTQHIGADTKHKVAKISITVLIVVIKNDLFFPAIA